MTSVGCVRIQKISFGPVETTPLHIIRAPVLQETIHQVVVATHLQEAQPSWTSTIDTELRTPLIDLDTLRSPELTFWYHMYGQDIDKLRVYIKTQGSPASLVSTITGQKQSSSTASWLKKSINLLPYEGDTIQVIFKGYRDGSGGFFSYLAQTLL